MAKIEIDNGLTVDETIGLDQQSWRITRNQKQHQRSVEHARSRRRHRDLAAENDALVAIENVAIGRRAAPFEATC